MWDTPLPERQWGAMRAVFGDADLATLLGISRASLARYASGERTTPNEIAARLHWLAMVVADLAGAYNEWGIRGWFERRREALRGRSPRQALGARWSPEGEAARRLRALAAALADLGAT